MPKAIATSSAQGLSVLDGDPDVAHREQQQDAPDQVVHVGAALGLHVAGPPAHLRLDHVRARADEAEGEDEGDQHEEVELLARRLDAAVVGTLDVVEEALHRRGIIAPGAAGGGWGYPRADDAGRVRRTRRQGCGAELQAELSLRRRVGGRGPCQDARRGARGAGLASRRGRAQALRARAAGSRGRSSRWVPTAASRRLCSRARCAPPGAHGRLVSVDIDPVCARVRAERRSGSAGSQDRVIFARGTLQALVRALSRHPARRGLSRRGPLARGSSARPRDAGGDRADRRADAVPRLPGRAQRGSG